MTAARQTRAEKKAETRERLLAAAERIARRDGFARLTLDRVAEAAGLTKGAVYSNFESKEQFLLEVAVRASAGITMGDEVFDRAANVAELLEAMAEVIASGARQRPKEAVVALEFVTLALREPKLRRVLAGQQTDEAGPSSDRGDRWIEAHRHELPLPDAQFFEVVNALAWGLLLRRLVVGEEAVPDDLMTWAFTRLVDSSD
jgi:AcrR family transcriptional regulator